MEFYAHSIYGKPVDDWHRLEEHEGTVPDLRMEQNGVVESGLFPAKRSAALFAAEFGCGEWGYPAGLWHVNRSRFIGKLGKYSSFRAKSLEHIGVGAVKPVDKIHDIWHSSYKCSYMEVCNEIR
ncbi:MAG: hypothetical protein PHT49_05685 [Desulfovibrionales bacterium]|nr:hypothetical protein [Desulfovibrionales bacterium]